MIKDVPEPSAGEGEVVVRVKACAICGSDLSIYKLGVSDRILGHEFSGEIVEVGTGVKNWKSGDRIVAEPQITCGECFFCRRNETNRCLNVGFTGLSIDGALAEYVKFPAYQLHQLPAEISYEQGAMIEPLAVALRGVQQSGLKFGDTAAVFGLGIIGLFSVVWASAFGADRVVGMEVTDARIKVGERIMDVVVDPAKVDPVEEIAKLTSGIGPHVIYECSGNPNAQNQAIAAVRRGGTIMLLGMSYEPIPCMFLAVSTKEITIKGSVAYSTGSEEFPTTIQALRSKKIDISKIPVLEVGLDDVNRAFEASLHGDVAKAIVIP